MCIMPIGVKQRMYKCNQCGNTTHFEELNLMRTFLHNGVQTDEKFERRYDVICCECGEYFSDGYIEEIKSDLPEFHTKLMNEITEFCSHECGQSDNCSEHDCVLYRIEQLVLNDC